ncbi:hypothetical protein ACC760_39010, partial [Rhizobium ruizarguesonis]
GFIGISLASAAILINISLWSTHDYVATVAAYGIITRIMTFTYLQAAADAEPEAGAVIVAGDRLQRDAEAKQRQIGEGHDPRDD